MSLHLIQGKHLLIDGDLLRYRCGFAFDKAKELGNETDFRTVVDVTVDSIIRTCGPTSFEVWLSGPHNFRELISPTYKANRKDLPKPKYFKEIKDYLIEKYDAKVSGGAEADDEIGIRLTADPIGRVCVSWDKDLGQISGWHHDPLKDRTFWVSRKAGDFRLYTQILAGDTTDNFFGIRGIGPKKAEKILEGSASSRELCQRAWSAYKSNGYSADQFLENAKLAYIHRWPADEYRSPIVLE